MKLTRVVALTLLAVCLSTYAHAGRRVCGDGPVVIKASVGQAVDIVVEDGVGDLVRSGDPATLKVEHTSGHLFVTPLTRDPAGLVVIDGQGRSHPFKYIFDDGVDEKIIIGDCGRSDGAGGQESLTVNIMRALILGHAPAGSSEKKSEAVMFEDAEVRMRAIMLYELPQAFGYFLSIENKTQRPVVVPVQRITYPGIVAIASDIDVLAPGGSARMYMVVKR